MTTPDQPGGLLSEAQVQARLDGLDGWGPSADGKAIARRFNVKGYARAVELANLAAWLGNQLNHHADIRFGWGYCEVSFTSHDAGGLTERDLDGARRLNRVLAEAGTRDA
ncbi:4a-hydroxytetrahydrobiopterin dehydratase [Paracoccus jeotgali]|uniref:4a-hydroxytetrahydrobiopterin dehydratase n=1 Tax=Paracoccus jeotgali TaxID=2065379 RepID=A0A2K9MBH1_9RHOB|nr:4a-hydroxytetrahydrobiopterin dehydratase [Paracoccus jeotgali]AUM72999.1 pterin-4-alpha-carbinolamine dehydratase [Paracoccus jeotgali]